jgi:phytoene dehydrogenase-like protein
METYDIITVGSGHNALVAAALLVRAGNRVLVLGQPSHRTVVPNVFLVGADTWPGGGVNGGSGYIVAHQLLKQALSLIKE